MYRILLVDDHQIIRDGVRQLLQGEQDLKVVAEANNAREAIRELEVHSPDIVITDLSMPGLEGFGLIENINEKFPNTRVIVLSMHIEEAYVRKAISLEVAGYLSKDSSRSELLEAIRQAGAGEPYFNSKVAKMMMGAMVKKSRPGSYDENPVQKLTTRENEIIELIVQGMSSVEIADKLFISSRTVENHRANIMNKLCVKNTIGLVRYFYENRHAFGQDHIRL